MVVEGNQNSERTWTPFVLTYLHETNLTSGVSHFGVKKISLAFYNSSHHGRDLLETEAVESADSSLPPFVEQEPVESCLKTSPSHIS